MNQAIWYQKELRRESYQISNSRLTSSPYRGYSSSSAETTSGFHPLDLHPSILRDKSFAIRLCLESQSILERPSLPLSPRTVQLSDCEMNERDRVDSFVGNLGCYWNNEGAACDSNDRPKMEIGGNRSG